MEKNKNYSMFWYYKGEKENPYDNITQNAQCQFWWYERVFEHKFSVGTIKGDKKKAFDDYLNSLFIHLSDRYDSMDMGNVLKIFILTRMYNYI